MPEVEQLAHARIGHVQVLLHFPERLAIRSVPRLGHDQQFFAVIGQNLVFLVVLFARIFQHEVDWKTKDAPVTLIVPRFFCVHNLIRT